MKQIRFFLLFFFYFLCFYTGKTQTVYRTKTFSEVIKSLQVKIADELISVPYLKMEGDKQIEINFDAMEHNFTRYAYQVIHCDADWKQSILSPIDYISGFQGMPIDDYVNSIATTVEYTNYRLFLPNENTQFKVSGNYAVRIYDEDKPDETVLLACFSVVDKKINIDATVSSSTTIDFNKGHQQVSFTINHKGLPIAQPLSDLKIYVYQNSRIDNVVTNLKPISILDNRITYEHNRELIFEAGNEYRRFEVLTHRYNGMGIDHIQFHNPYYHAVLHMDFPRTGQSYIYDQDQNGRFFPACSGCNEPDRESDYYIVHFSLEREPFLDGEVYINGDLFNNVLDGKSKMNYNFDSGLYEKFVLLKGGNYNYQYLFVRKGQTNGSTEPIEGNYHQTENEYLIAVYYRPMGSRYDQLIGTVKVESTKGL